MCWVDSTTPQNGRRLPLRNINVEIQEPGQGTTAPRHHSSVHLSPTHPSNHHLLLTTTPSPPSPKTTSMSTSAIIPPIPHPSDLPPPLHHDSDSQSTTTTTSSPLILYRPPTVISILRTAAINLFLPFINGLMLGFGELFAHEIAFRLGWGGTRVSSMSPSLFILPSFRLSRSKS